MRLTAGEWLTGNKTTSLLRHKYDNSLLQTYIPPLLPFLSLFSFSQFFLSQNRHVTNAFSKWPLLQQLTKLGLKPGCLNPNKRARYPREQQRTSWASLPNKLRNKKSRCPNFRADTRPSAISMRRENIRRGDWHLRLGFLPSLGSMRALRAYYFEGEHFSAHSDGYLKPEKMLHHPLLVHLHSYFSILVRVDITHEGPLDCRNQWNWLFTKQGSYI